VIHLADHVFFIAQPDRGESKLSGIAGHPRVGQRIELQIRFHARVDRDRTGGKNAITGIRREGIHRRRQPFCLSQSFIIAEEKGLVFLDPSADGAAKLMAAKRRNRLPVEKFLASSALLRWK